MPRRRALRVMAGAVAAAVLPGWLARPAQARRVTCTGEEFLCQCPSINGLFFNVCCPGNYKCTCKAPPDGAAICSCADDRKCGDACCKVGAVCADADLGYCCEPRELACRGGGTRLLLQARHRLLRREVLRAGRALLQGPLPQALPRGHEALRPQLLRQGAGVLQRQVLREAAEVLLLEPLLREDGHVLRRDVLHGEPEVLQRTVLPRHGHLLRQGLLPRGRHLRHDRRRPRLLPERARRPRGRRGRLLPGGRRRRRRSLLPGREPRVQHVRPAVPGRPRLPRRVLPAGLDE